MTDPLYELLTPYLTTSTASPSPLPHHSDTTTSKYLARLTTLPLSALTSDEPTTLTQSTHSNLLALQSLSARSTTALVASSTHLASLRSTLPRLASSASSLRHEIPDLDTQAVAFSDRYSRAREENELLDRRKRALLLARNIDRLSDILDLPTLLESAIASSTSSSSSSAATAQPQPPQPSRTTTTTNSTSAPSPLPSSYASALDLHSHIKRLHLLYPDSPLVDGIFAQTESAMRDLTSNLILSLRSQNIKLAAGMRTVGWLRRVAPELDAMSMVGGAGSNSDHISRNLSSSGGTSGSSEGSLGALFLVCRLNTLLSMLSALSPLRDLADQETELRLRSSNNNNSNNRGSNSNRTANKATVPPQKKSPPPPPPPPPAKDTTTPSSSTLWSSGQQTERYLKRYIEIFREQSFAIVSMYRSIFPSPSLPPSASSSSTNATNANANANPTMVNSDPLTPQPSALSTFPLHLLSQHLMATLRVYLPNIRDRPARESLLTQVLYAAGSLGRMGGDFGVGLEGLGLGLGDGDGDDDDDDDDGGDGDDTDREEEEGEGEKEWVNVMRKQRVLAGRLEVITGGGGGG